MARIVVLVFDPNEDAETFIEDWLKNKDADGFAKITTAEGNTVEAEVTGLYAQATQFCSGEFSHKADGVGLARTVFGRKYGWWVCAVCRKPRGRMMEPRIIGEGRNILKEFVHDILNPTPVVVE